MSILWDFTDSQALLYYTFAALQGYRPAEMALGYRHWAGISVQEVCPLVEGDALFLIFRTVLLL
jgi:TPR repeat protein